MSTSFARRLWPKNFLYSVGPLNFRLPLAAFVLALQVITPLALAAKQKTGPAAPAPSCAEMIANLNTFNSIHDSVYMPDEATEKVKVENLVSWVTAANSGRGALIQTFEEISDEVLQRLAAHDKIVNLGYGTHLTSGKPDGRGIDVGLISKLPVIGEPKAHIYWKTDERIWGASNTTVNDPTGGALTRPILEVHLRLPNGEEVTVFVNHWASQLKEDWSVLRRYEASAYLKTVTDGILAANKDANIVILGDFNTGPYGPEMKAGLDTADVHQGEVADPELAHLINLEDTLIDLNYELKQFKKANPHATFKEIEEYQEKILEKEGTYYYAAENEWDAFDQMILSTNMFKYLVKGSFGPIRNQGFVDADGKPIPFHPKTGEGLTDHLGDGALFIFDNHQ